MSNTNEIILTVVGVVFGLCVGCALVVCAIQSVCGGCGDGSCLGDWLEKRRRARESKRYREQGVVVELGKGGAVRLKDTNGDGELDCVVEHVPKNDPKKPAKPRAIDTSGDGLKDSVLVDESGDGFYDTIIEKEQAELTMLAVEAQADVKSPRKKSRSPRRSRSPSPRPHAEVSDRGRLSAPSASPRASSFPSYWDLNDLPEQAEGDVHVVESNYVFKIISSLLSDTFDSVRTRDRKSVMPERLEAVKIFRVENSAVWRRYNVCRNMMKKRFKAEAKDSKFPAPPPITREHFSSTMQRTLEEGVSEHYLFHGTSPSGAVGIKETGFDLQRVGTGAGSLYGAGLYFAEKSSKSDEYARADAEGPFAGHCAMLLCRVLLGEPLVWDTEVTGELSREWNRHHYDSILGDREKLRGTYREFILPKAVAMGAYPEYIIIYKRIMPPLPPGCAYA